MSEQEFKSVVIPCKRCAQEYELRLPMRTCPDCRADDPFLRMLDEAGIPTVGRDFSRKLSNKYKETNKQ